ncbi:MULTISPECIES: hypothetical protein [unclassified Streptomyces]|uniref:hypothetical protein n=1 Tax=unclassified Streptomyces TaxID=2593676 RepID=UPI00093B1C14|nr:hypothetical protein [Streptomyces sp. CB02400]OKK10810.1 hypothetical protein AMK33_11725 [Streptomyces sp. CB02400]
MDLSWFQSQTAQQLRAEGRAEGEAKAVLVLLGHRGVEVSEENRERIAGCRDLDTLHVWFIRAITATSAAEVFEGATD